MQSEVTGRVWKYGDKINTDLIIATRYMLLSEDEQVGKTLEALDPTFASEARPGDIIVAGEEFGSGSSRGQAVSLFQRLGVACIVAKSFARLYFRNGINSGLPLVVCPAAVDTAEKGDTLQVDFLEGKVENLTRGGVYEGTRLPAEMLEMLSAGGLIPYLERRLAGAATEG